MKDDDRRRRWFQLPSAGEAIQTIAGYAVGWFVLVRFGFWWAVLAIIGFGWCVGFAGAALADLRAWLARRRT